MKRTHGILRWPLGLGLTVVCLAPVCLPPLGPAWGQGVAEGKPASAAAGANPLHEQLAELLATGMPAAKRGDLSAAKKHYDEALRLSPSSADAHLAYALVQLHNQQNAAGQKTLELLLTGDGPVSPAAHQIQILLLLSKKNYSEATTAACAYADRIAHAPAERFPDVQKEAAARWLGRLIGFYLEPGKGITAAGSLTKRRGEIESLLSRELAAVFQAGIASIQKDYADLQAGVIDEVQSLTEDANREEAEALEKVFAGQEKTTGEKGKLKETGAQLEAWRTQHLDAVKLQLVPLMKQNQELYMLHEFTDQALKNSRIRAQLGKSQDRLYQELLTCEARIMQLRPKIKAWINAGMQVEAMYYQAKGQVAQKNADLAAYEQQLGKIKENIIDKKDSRIEVRAGKRKQETLRELGTYLPLNYRAERDRLLARLATAE